MEEILEVNLAENEAENEAGAKHKRKDLLDKKYELKKFMKLIFNDFNIGADEYIRILQLNDKTSYRKVSYFNDIDELVNFTTNKYKMFNNTFFNLATTNKMGGADENLIKRCVLGFDFDKKNYDYDFTHHHIIEKFKELKLWYHAIVDSGNGYHVYMVIEPTNDLEKVQEVQKSIGKLLGCDMNATLKTQILRVPYTFNLKQDKAKEVRIISQFHKTTIKKYDINQLHKKYCSEFRKNENDKNVVVNLNNNYPPCVASALKNGSKVGSRNKDLFNIVVALKQRGNNVNQIKFTIHQWNKLNEEPLLDNHFDLDGEVERIFNNYNGHVCNSCDIESKENCKSYATSDFNLEQYKENIINIQHKVAKQCRSSKRKGVATMNGNELFIYNVLVNNQGFEELTIDMLMERITYRKTKKCALSKPTISKALKSLEEKGFITITKGNARLGIKDIYSINTNKIVIENSFRMSYMINLLVVKGEISTSELRVYTHMRFLHNQDVASGKAKGNIFVRSLDDLAKSLGDDKANVSRYVESLWESMVLDRRSVQCKDKPQNFYYEYKLNM